MPNHCYQSVYLAGNPKKIDRLYKAVKEERFLDEVIPQPTNLFHGALGEEERKMCEEKGISNWYDWRNENWLTKWDICDAEIDGNGLEYSDDKTEAWFSFRCWTAWAPPVPVWDRLHALGIEVQADYEDEGLNFAGEYANGVDRVGNYQPWTIERLEPETEEA
tara:strand:+ start:974 stop:1462 length:489 start_codon:yes stop_codon:yes gene_type:complete